MSCISFFFFNDTATTEIYTLSLHDALPICPTASVSRTSASAVRLRSPRAWSAHHSRSTGTRWTRRSPLSAAARSEEHTSELQSRQYLVCRLLLEKKKTTRHLVLLTSPRDYI